MRPGLSRVHYTLVTGAITSMKGGARHAFRLPPRWHRILNESLRIRRHRLIRRVSRGFSRLRFRVLPRFRAPAPPVDADPPIDQEE